MAVAGLLPSFPAFGSDGNFCVSFALAPFDGIMLGPFTGALSIAIGEFIGSIIAPHNVTLGIFMFIINAANAFTAGYISHAVRMFGLSNAMDVGCEKFDSPCSMIFAVYSLISCVN